MPERRSERPCPGRRPRYSRPMADVPHDLKAHIRSAVTQTSLSIPVAGRRTVLGTWQGVFLLEHRTAPHRREVVLHLIGA